MPPTLVEPAGVDAAVPPADRGCEQGSRFAVYGVANTMITPYVHVVVTVVVSRAGAGSTVPSAALAVMVGPASGTPTLRAPAAAAAIRQVSESMGCMPDEPPRVGGRAALVSDQASRNRRRARVAATTRIPADHASALRTGCSAEPVPSVRARSASITLVTGCALANVLSQPGIVSVDVNVDAAKTSGKVTTSAASVAASTLRTARPRSAKSQEQAYPKNRAIPIPARMDGSPLWNRKPTSRPIRIISATV